MAPKRKAETLAALITLRVKATDLVTREELEEAGETLEEFTRHCAEAGILWSGGRELDGRTWDEFPR